MAIEKGFEGIMIRTEMHPMNVNEVAVKSKIFYSSLEVVDKKKAQVEMKVNLVLLFVKAKTMVIPRVNVVGSGLTDDNRDEFWPNKDKLIGQIVEVRADALNPRY